jgi:hypothetical protein
VTSRQKTGPDFLRGGTLHDEVVGAVLLYDLTQAMIAFSKALKGWRNLLEGPEGQPYAPSRNYARIS